MDQCSLGFSHWGNGRSRHGVGVLLGLLASVACSSEHGSMAASGLSGAYTPSARVVAEAESPSPQPEVQEQIASNPFVSTSHDPLSTFAADVDTASYDLFRQYVSGGDLPPPETVRLEEFVNYFTYDYPAPEAGAEQPFSIALAAAPNLLDAGTTLLRVGIQGRHAEVQDKRPTNLVFLVDISGSMEGELPLVQQLLRDALGILEEDDTVSIVTYAGVTGVALEPTAVRDQKRILDAIDDFVSGGSTAGSAGLDLAYEQATAGFIEGGTNHVVLCTDGDFNVGPSSTPELLDQIEEKRKSGVTLTALGFGSEGVNDGMLEVVSNAGNGIYGVISTPAQAQRYVEERLLQNLTLIAKDMKIQVEFNAEHVEAYRLLGYENRAIADEDFRDDVVDAGEIGAGHRVTALYELVLAGDELPEVAGAPDVETGEAYSGEVEVDAQSLVLVKVRYKDVDATEEDAAYETAAQLTPDDIAGSVRDLDADLQWAVGIAAFAELLKGSPYAREDNINLISEVFEAQSERDDDRRQFWSLFQSGKQLMQSGVR